ncbi:MAG TPA: gluconate 2-dehydrogenase subunit 3 family protein [Gemmatimonadaceae bacterium]
MIENDTMTEIDISNELSADLISRREAILRMSVLLGGVALIGSGALISGCRAEKATPSTAFTPDDIAYLDEIADTILPTTSTPGAKAAKTGAFMALMVTDTYHDDDEKTFRDGMRKLDDLSKSKNGASFMKATPAQRLALLQELDKEQHDYSEKQRAEGRKKSDAFINDTKQQNAPEAKINPATAITSEPPNPSKYFRMMKELALLGYFTSEVGATQALRYVESPGRYDPCVPYKPGERDWASHA